MTGRSRCGSGIRCGRTGCRSPSCPTTWESGCHEGGRPRPPPRATGGVRGGVHAAARRCGVRRRGELPPQHDAPPGHLLLSIGGGGAGHRARAAGSALRVVPSRAAEDVSARRVALLACALSLLAAACTSGPGAKNGRATPGSSGVAASPTPVPSLGPRSRLCEYPRPEESSPPIATAPLPAPVRAVADEVTAI